MSRKLTVINFPKPGMSEVAGRATGQSYERGSDIYDSGLVRSVNVINNGVTATVGRNGYHTQITWDDHKQDWIFKCSCPYDWGGICKHLVALGCWVDENCEEKIEDKSEDRREELLQLIREADENTKNEILLELLLSDNILVEKLKTKAADLESSPGDKSIDELVAEYIKLFHEIELPDEEEALERSYHDYDHYVEPWEMAEEIQRDDLELQTSDIFDNIERLIETGRFLEAVFDIIALLEALRQFGDEIEEEDEDEYENFPDGETIELFRNYFYEKIQEAYLLLSRQIMKEETQEKILETIRTRYNKKIPFYLLEDLLISISFNETTAGKLLKILQQKQYRDYYSKLQIKLVDTLEDHDLKLKIYERFAGVNDQAASFLLTKYENDKKEYHRVAAKVVHKIKKKMNSEIFPHLDPAINIELYQRTALLMFEETNEIIYYRKYKETVQEFDYQELLKNYQQENYLLHSFKILIEEERFQEAYDLFIKKSDYILSDRVCLPYLIAPLSLKCYTYITQRALIMLRVAGSRDTYAEAGYLLSLLLAYPDKELKQQGILLIEQICRKYKNRPAMLDEFRARGISC
ncbi:MAG: hypothetical protein K9N06_13260 [Candidatus Cloacimonetes bacterium]|nr:hypothetical protein [Candidatus Cloacimonadota bacterium]